MKQPNRLATLWRLFEDTMIPPQASVPMRRVLRRAFYAGAAGMFGEVTKGETGSETEGIVTLSGLALELEQYAKTMHEEDRG